MTSRWLRLALALLLFPGFGVAAAGHGEGASHLRLLDPLDRPGDGYCVDIPGTAQNLRTDLPLFAHNCKPAHTADSTVMFTREGEIRFPAVDRCMTVAGVNGGALPGAAVLLRPCGESKPFFHTAELQRLVLHDDGRLVLRGTQLCLSVGSRSAPTYSPADRWRTLFIDDCDRAPKRSRWEHIVPGG